MDTNLQNNKESIASKIKEKAPNLKCPACSQNGFAFAEGYFAHDLQDNLDSRQMGGKNIPVVPIVYKNCGYIMEFAAGALGLLPKPNEINK